MVEEADLRTNLKEDAKTPQTDSICGVFVLVPYRYCPLLTFCPFEQYYFGTEGVFETGALKSGSDLF